MGEVSTSTGFYFELSITGSTDNDSAIFQEISGIVHTSVLETDPVESGENRFMHKVPERIKYTNLVLKRGLVSKNAALLKWCSDTLSGGLGSAMEPKNITVKLMNPNSEVIQQWHFYKAYPIRWEIANIEGSDNEITVEKMEFAYGYFTTG